MSQETEFRAWHLIYNKMALVDRICFVNRTIDLLAHHEPICGVSFTDIELMQKIGRKDSNDNDAFKDDIIEFDDTDIGGFKGRARIVYEYDLTLVPAPGWYLETSDKRIIKQWPSGFKIIGNNLENPELLAAE